MKLFIIILSSFLTTSAIAVEVKLNSDGGVILFDAPKSWELRHDLFGMKNWLFSPKSNNSRSNLTVTNTKAKISLDISEIKKSQKSYERLKRNWADKVNATVISFKTLKSFKNDRGNQVSSIGFSYVHKNKRYLENSYYIECRGTIIFSKSLRLEVNEDHQSDIDRIVRSMDCSL